MTKLRLLKKKHIKRNFLSSYIPSKLRLIISLDSKYQASNMVSIGSRRHV